jgi:tRNA(fMet)-specific endonuclease VapC
MRVEIAALPFEAVADTEYRAPRVAREAAGTPLGSHDLLKAPHARATASTVVAANADEIPTHP